MIYSSKFKTRLQSICTFCTLHIKNAAFGMVLLAGIQSTLMAQEAKYTVPSFWIGAAAASNVNFYNGSTQNLNSNVTAPVAFHEGFGFGLFLAPLVEYYKHETVLGFMFQAGYDGRSGKFNQVKSPCNCPRDLSTKLSYLTLEPSLRIAPFKSSFYMFVGPRFAFNLDKSFTYKQGTNPQYPDQVTPEDISGDLSSMNKTLISMQAGIGYDVFLSKESKRTQVIFSPFISIQPYFGQNPRSTETWNITTIRVGAALKIGNGRKIKELEKTFAQDTMINNLDKRVKKNATDINDLKIQEKKNSETNNRQDSAINSLKTKKAAVVLRRDSLKVGVIYEFNNVQFETNKAELNYSATQELDELAALMIENRLLKIAISGHADERGTESANQVLSARRSQAIIDYLLSKGVNRDKLVVDNYGERRPLDKSSTKEAWRANRRVEFLVLER